MKTAYRIVTPILALGGIALGIFLKLFSFVVGNSDDTINNLISAVSQLSSGKFSTTYSYSLFELIKMAATSTPKTGEDAKSFTEVASAIMPNIYAFAALFAVMLVVLIATAVVAACANTKKKRNASFFLCGFGLAVSIACIFVSNGAFAKITEGDVNLTDLVSLFSDNTLVTLATAILTVKSASLSAGFHSVFGIYLLIIIWTVLSNMLINTPIHSTKTYKRKKPMRRLIPARKK